MFSMSTTAIYIPTETKQKAEKLASELGLNLQTIIVRFLRQFIKTKTIPFNRADEIPNKRTLAIMKQAEKNLKEGNHSPIFNSGKEAVEWLEKQGI